MPAAYDTSSFPAFLRSLDISGPVTTHGGRIVAGPPAPLLDVALALGLGPLIFDSARNRQLLATIGIPPQTAQQVARRLRRRSLWRTAWEEAAAPCIAEAEALAAQGQREQALSAARLALALLGLAFGGDNYYFYTPIPERRAAFGARRQLIALIRELAGDVIEGLSVPHAHGVAPALLHLPPIPVGRVPALVALHPLGGDKDNFDYVLALFREAG